MRRGETPCDAGVNARANPFAVRAGQSREAVVEAVRRMLQGVPWAMAAEQLSLLPHPSYLCAAGSRLDAAIRREVLHLAGMVQGGSRLFLACGCACGRHGREQAEPCHGDQWEQAVRKRAAGAALERQMPAAVDATAAAVQAAKGRLFLDMFGGEQPVVAKAASWRNFVTVTLDTCLDPGSDLSRRAVAAQWVRECVAGNVGAYKSDMPCVSFTCLWGKPAGPGQQPKPKLRSRACLPGLPPIPPEWVLYMRKHEAFVDLTFDCATPTVLHGGRAVVVGPADRGNEALGELYRRAYADHAPLELHPRALRLDSGGHGGAVRQARGLAAPAVSRRPVFRRGVERSLRAGHDAADQASQWGAR